MKVNTLEYTREFLEEFTAIYFNDICEGNPSAFSRFRKISPLHLQLQMFNQKGKTQFSKLTDFYKEMNMDLNISTVGFYKARMKFNPNAIKLMSKDFIANIYDKENESMVKLNGYIVTAIDGSDFILPSTPENAEIYGRAKSNNSAKEEDCPVMGKLSVVYDCINKCIFDSEIGKYKHSERDFASKHLETLKESLRVPTITIFDRGYYSLKLANQMIKAGQYFLFRLTSTALIKQTGQLECGDDKTFEINFTREQTNEYRDDKVLRANLLNTTFKFRIVKVKISNKEKGTESEEILLTNLSDEEFDIDGLKELYHLRWGVETAYNILKNRMKLEEFSGYKEWLVRQDIYSTIWLFNIIMLQIIEVNEKHEIPQDRYTYKMKTNINIAIGIIKSSFISSIINEDAQARYDNMTKTHELISKHLVPVRDGRQFKRGNTKNKSRMGYRYTY